MTSGGRVRAGLGVSSLTLILLTLCLTLLGTLSLADARAEQSLRKRQEALTAAYYQAAFEAQRTLACMDEQMAQAYARCSDEEEYAQQCTALTSAGDTDVEWTDDAHAVFYLDAGFERRLCVEIERCRWDEAHAQRFTVVRHVLEDMKQWQEQTQLELIA